MKISASLLAILSAFFLTHCSGDKAQELFETAQFEERQGNISHAVELYEDILRTAPSSPQAEQAKARLAQLTNHQQPR